MLESPNIAKDIESVLKEQETAPRGLDKIVRLGQEARNAKKLGNKEAWANALDEFKIASEGARLAEKERHMKERQNLKEELHKMTVKFNNAASKKALTSQAIKKWDAGEYQTFYILAGFIEDLDPKIYEQMGKIVGSKLLENDNYRQLAAGAFAGLSEEAQSMMMFEMFIKPKMDEMNAPELEQKPKQAETSRQIPKHLQGMIKSPIDIAQKGKGYDLESLMAWHGKDMTPGMKAKAALNRGDITLEEYEQAIKSQLGLVKPEEEMEWTGDAQELEWLKQNWESMPQELKDLVMEEKASEIDSITEEKKTAAQSDYEYFEDVFKDNPDLWKAYQNKEAGVSRSETDEQRLQMSLQEMPFKERQDIQALLTENTSPSMITGIRTLPGFFKSLDTENIPKEEKDKIKINMLKNTHYANRDPAVRRQLEGFERVMGFFNRIKEHLEENPTLIDENGNWNRANTNLLNRFAQNIYHAFGWEFDPALDTFQTEFQWQLAMFIKDISGAQASDKEVARLFPVLPGSKDTPNLSLSKIRAIEAAIRNAFRIEFSKFSRETQNGIWEQVQGNSLTPNQRAKREINTFRKNNPNATESEVLEHTKKVLHKRAEDMGLADYTDLPEVESTLKQMESHIRSLFSENVRQLEDYISESNFRNIDEAFSEIAEKLSPSNLKSFADTLESVWAKKKGKVEQIDTDTQNYIESIQVIRGIASETADLKEFISTVSANLTDQTLGVLGWTKAELKTKLTELYNKVHGNE